jgi:hypothetical protein
MSQANVEVVRKAFAYEYFGRGGRAAAAAAEPGSARSERAAAVAAQSYGPR